ncbi:MAG: hypothetical protein DWQ10_01045 [Calditrichaeota bacterium]|nr:MAG: hypothetical protein DWQ10_01045 [Calditrichota bacterium]
MTDSLKAEVRGTFSQTWLIREVPRTFRTRTSAFRNDRFAQSGSAWHLLARSILINFPQDIPCFYGVRFLL